MMYISLTIFGLSYIFYYQHKRSDFPSRMSIMDFMFNPIRDTMATNGRNYIWKV